MTLEADHHTDRQAPQAKAMEQAKERWDTIAKPLDSLGLLEEAVVRIAGLTGDSGLDRIDKRCVAVLCADNGVVAQGVTQTGQRDHRPGGGKPDPGGHQRVPHGPDWPGADVVPVDIGMLHRCGRARPVAVQSRPMAPRTSPCGPAMTRQQAVQALETGIGLVARS